ncbi:MAG: outer membrane protein assembly factor BamC [Pseudomonadota bacterium]|jgi:uncharacterized lipoprotein
MKVPARWARGAVSMAVLVSAGLSGCSMIASWFPDKQKQYRYHSETPPLEVPPDLTSSEIQGAVTSTGRATGIQFDESRAAGGYADETADSGVNARQSVRSGYGRRAENSVQPGSEEATFSQSRSTLAQSVSDVPLIEIEASYEEAWGALARALGRMKVEVIDQNESDGVFHVFYTPQQAVAAREKEEEQGFLQSLFSRGNRGERPENEYRVRLERLSENIVQTFITDQAGNPVADGPGLDLLHALNEQLQAPQKH